MREPSHPPDVDAAFCRKDALHTTLESSYFKLESDLKACKESLKTSQYNLSVETRKAAEAETALDKTRKETKDHASQRHNFEATIRNQEKSLEERQREVKQLQRGQSRHFLTCSQRKQLRQPSTRFGKSRDVVRRQHQPLCRRTGCVQEPNKEAAS